MAQSATPAIKSNELIGRLAVVVRSRTNDELEISRIERDANALMDADPARAHMVLGSVSAARGDSKRTRHHYRVALQLSNSYTARLNYSVSLALLEEHEEALGVTQELLRQYPDDVGLLDHAIREAVESAVFADGAALCDHRDRVAPNRRRHPDDEVRKAAAAVAAGSFTEKGVREVLRGVADVQRGEGIRPVTFALRFDAGGESFLYVRGVNAAPEDVATLNERLAEHVVGRPELMEDPGMNFMVSFAMADVDGGNA